MGLKNGGLRSGGLRNVSEVAGIPSSVVLQYYATTWSQGDNTWVDDTGTADMTINGDIQAGTLSDGKESLNADGTDDDGQTSPPSSLSGSSLTSFSVEFAFETTDSSERGLIGANDSTDQTLTVDFNRNQGFNSDDGNFYFLLSDENLNRVVVSPSNNPNLNDGNRHNVSIIVNDSTTSDVDIIIDGTNQSLTFGESGNPSSFVNWDYNISHFSRIDNTGSTFSYLKAKLGAVRWHDSAISDQTINDY